MKFKTKLFIGNTVVYILAYFFFVKLFSAPQLYKFYFIMNFLGWLLTSIFLFNPFNKK